MKLYYNLILDGSNRIELSNIQMRILKELIIKALSRKQLVEKLETARTTIYDNLLKLQAIKINGASLVMNFSKKNSFNTKYRPEWGRPKIYWYIPRIILKKLEY